MEKIKYDVSSTDIPPDRISNIGKENSVFRSVDSDPCTIRFTFERPCRILKILFYNTDTLNSVSAFRVVVDGLPKDTLCVYPGETVIDDIELLVFQFVEFSFGIAFGEWHEFHSVEFYGEMVLDEESHDSMKSSGEMIQYLAPELQVRKVEASTSWKHGSINSVDSLVNGIGIKDDGSHSLLEVDMWLSAKNDEPVLRFYFEEPVRIETIVLYNYLGKGGGCGVKTFTLLVDDKVVLQNQELVGFVNLPQTFDVGVTCYGRVQLNLLNNFGGNWEQYFGLSYVGFRGEPVPGELISYDSKKERNPLLSHLDPELSVKTVHASSTFEENYEYAPVDIINGAGILPNGRHSMDKELMWCSSHDYVRGNLGWLKFYFEEPVNITAIVIYNFLADDGGHGVEEFDVLVDDVLVLENQTLTPLTDTPQIFETDFECYGRVELLLTDNFDKSDFIGLSYVGFCGFPIKGELISYNAVVSETGTTVPITPFSLDNLNQVIEIDPIDVLPGDEVLNISAVETSSAYEFAVQFLDASSLVNGYGLEPNGNHVESWESQWCSSASDQEREIQIKLDETTYIVGIIVHNYTVKEDCCAKEISIWIDDSPVTTFELPQVTTESPGFYKQIGKQGTALTLKLNTNYGGDNTGLAQVTIIARNQHTTKTNQ
eukprot:TRINITY_DN685_c0_g2_i1.p1 TRINITY_DN685_c0_g2~~TRINITY_DN685_c0_g2_i1.p1  ORF type:complete len:657 (+),score=122.88 TRINITY_DN685_c0_g2_i1:96-2066(+)